jgi:hypothetical protein
MAIMLSSSARGATIHVPGDMFQSEAAARNPFSSSPNADLYGARLAIARILLPVTVS